MEEAAAAPQLRLQPEPAVLPRAAGGQPPQDGAVWEPRQAARATRTLRDPQISLP